MAAASAQRGGGGLSLCLATAGIVKSLSVAAFTLAWTHSVEKVDWQEDWRVTATGLELVQARVKGSGAGMEPPPDATFDGQWWRYDPHMAPQPSVVLRRSGMTVGDWQVCISGACRTMGSYLPDPAADPVTLTTCP